MIRRYLPILLMALTAALGIQSLIPGPVSGHPEYFDDLCRGCHSNDTPTCNGCHHHIEGTLTANTDQQTYQPGQTVTVTLNGGTQHGWIRAILYDQTHTEITRATGPTGTGDDSLPNPIVFPVQLQGNAPSAEGDYQWEAAWFGNLNGTGHGEQGVTVTIHVQPTPTLEETWGVVRRKFR